ncbi:DUF2768 family protein [Tuberibacillus sp. Marseille-P3662]|uniref:DUF2768 family protein n=1 Tax=Tuberibacillus sp. Marseille-P3662 TaxID=1965358 RepID=UPI000A1CCD20|nr:DUF2768 family protein [Tuberibacillus sp. Marseille-P3662]
MSPGLMKMWISFLAIFLLVVAAVFIMLSRYKLSGLFRLIVSFIAYAFLFIGGILMIMIIFSSPV